MNVALAAILRVPWDHTNRRLPIRAWIETADGAEVSVIMEGEAEAGRPPGARGADVILVLAGPVNFDADEPLNLVVKLSFSGDTRELPVRLLDASSLQPGGRP